MARRRKARAAPAPSSEVGDGPQLQLQLDDVGLARDVLGRIVQTSGGQAGLLATWDPEADDGRYGTSPFSDASTDASAAKLRTATYNLDAETAHLLTDCLRELPTRNLRHLDDTVLRQLQDEVRAASARAGLGELEVLALPVRLHDRSVGVMCLLHPSHAVTVLKKSPSVYNVRLDEADVEQNARLLQRLLAERKWLEAIVAQNTNGIAVVDANGRIVGFNAAMEHITGWSLDDAVGHPAHDVFTVRLEQESGETALTPVRGAVPTFATRFGDHPVDAQIRARDGEWLDVEATTTTLWDDADTLLGWALTVRDIRARKEKERLEKIFMSSVSHELQTPIAVIKGFSGLLTDADVPFTVDQAREKAAIIHEESQRLERLVEQLLFATRIQAGGEPLQREPVAVAGLMVHTAQRLRGLAAQRGVTIDVVAPQALPTVLGDAGKLEQVLTNLIENALKYAAASPVQTITLAARDTGNEIEVSVTDTGPGVAREDRERIFHAFERGRGATRAAGSGLGLFICKSIVEAHGGRIGVDAPGDDAADPRGSRFYFTLPIAVGEEASE